MFKLFALLVAALLWGAWAVLKLREAEGEPLRKVLEGFSKLGWFNKVAILFVVAQLTMFGGAKHGGTNDVDDVSGTNGVDVVEGGGTNGVSGADGDADGNDGGTNAPPPVLSGPLMLAGGIVGPVSRIDDTDYENGYVLYRVGTNETFHFAPPPGAAIATNWFLRGAATDYIRIPIQDPGFPFRKLSVTNLVAFADGGISFDPSSGMSPPFDSAGVVPLANWGCLPECCNTMIRFLGEPMMLPASLFWWQRSDSGKYLLTWQNMLVDRIVTNPASYQVELAPNGNFDYRFDLSNLPPNHSVFSSLPAVPDGATVTSLSYHRLVDEDRENHDRDGDGLTTEAEIFDYGTDPGLPDSDFDGVSDGLEIALRTNPFARDSDGDGFPDATDPHPGVVDSHDDTNGDGFPDAWATGWFGDEPVDPDEDPGQDGIDNRTALLLGVNPLASGTNGFVEASVAKPVNLNAWVISPSAFSFDCPEGRSNLIVRTFSVERVSPWQQFFVSSRPEGADGWQSSDVVVEWEAGECSGVLPESSTDSFRIPLGTNDYPSTMTFRVVAAGARPSLSRPLYLLRWTPHLGFRPSYNVCVFNQDRQRIAVRPDPESGAYSLPFSLDRGGYPHHGGIDALVAAELAQPPVEGLRMSGDGFTASSPSAFDLPPEGLEPSRQLIFYELTVGSSARVPSGPRASQYDSPYPLDSKSLRRSYQENHHETTEDRVSVTILPDIPELGFVDLSPRLMRGLLGASGSVSAPGSVGPTVNGDPCTNDTHNVERTPDGADPEPEDDKPKGCDCNKDGTSFGSFRIRISFGEPGREEISGYLWAQIASPTLVRASTFNILGKSGVSAVTNDTGDVLITCADDCGRMIAVSNVIHGVDVFVRLASGELDSIWQVRNPDGDPSTIRARRLTHLLNATVDETYAIRHNDEGLVLWIQTDNITGVRREKIEVPDPDEPAFICEETEYTYLGDRLIREETRIYERIGVGRSAVRRLSSVSGRDERGYYNESNAYYCDAAHVYRHGKLRSCRSDRKAWFYADYDFQGRETIRIEQMDGSPFPDLAEVALNTYLGDGVSAKITLKDYESTAADSDDRNDLALPRLAETYVRVNGGTPILVSRTEQTCTRQYDSRHIPVRRIVTREGFGTSQRTSVRFEYPEDTAVPAALRGLEISSEEPDGSVIETDYAMSNAFIIATTRTSFNGNYRKTYTVTVYDAAFRLPLREETRLTENDVVIEWTANAYDDRQRLRSSTYSDGTSETNAYSCCRLLWRRDREGRRVLRSARTGTDSLYYAEEDVWRARISEDGRFRIVQHFFDGLGRETNTVTYAGSNEGEAVDPVVPASWQHPIVRTTEYIDEWSCRESFTTDERGAFIDQWEYATENAVENYSQTTADERTFGESRTTYRGGKTETYRWWDDKWTRQTASTSYEVNGFRVDTMVTESSDCGTVTNSVVTYDPLGRIVSQATPLGTTHFTYEGATARMLSEAFTAGDLTRVSSYLYDESGEELGLVLNGVANCSEIAYEEESNAWWKVTRESVVADEGTSASAATNSFTVTREQLTGLGVGLRSRVITDVMNGEKSSVAVTYNPTTGYTTETRTSSVASPVITRSYCGVETSRTTDGETSYFWCDAFSRNTYTERDDALTWHPVSEKEYDDVGDLVSLSVYKDFYWDFDTEYYEYDQLGNRVLTVRANGEEMISEYDPAGNLLSEDGATYPVRFAYDSQNRRVSMRTNREGDDWDVTQWAVDPLTGLYTGKDRADGTRVGYSYTPDGLPESTVRSNGHWVRNVYDANRQVVGIETDDSDDVTIGRDIFGREVSAQSAGASYAYQSAVGGVVTNETATLSGTSHRIRREIDMSGRIVGFGIADGYLQQTIVYRDDGRIEAVSNADVVVTYAYAEDGRNLGYVLTASNGTMFVRTLVRDEFRRDLVIDVSNTFGPHYAYTYDLLQRPLSRNFDYFRYNSHGEVVTAEVGLTHEAYAYDNIGNATSFVLSSTTNTYVANAVNEYVGMESGGEQLVTAYDQDGNLTQCGEWSYTYDAHNRLVTASSNGLLVASNFYDYKGRRVRMVTPDAVSTFVYDGWNLVLQLVEHDGTTDRIEYYWGKDISESLQGAGGIGGLLYVKLNGSIYVPVYDAYGNVMQYRSADGTLVASYTYDPFGRTLTQSGPLADVFRFRHATKFYESETGFYYYGYRHYVPALARWLTPDPIEEDGGLNLYAFCANNALNRWDALGESWLTDWNTLYCMGDCIERWRLDWIGMSADLMKWSSRAAIIVGPVPKSAFELGHAPAGVSDNTSQLSRGISVVEHLARMLPLGSKVRYGIIRTVGDIRRFMRLKPMVGFAYANQALVVLEGFYDIGVMIYCAGHCYCCDNID